MRDWKRWTAVLLAGSLAFTAADDMKLIVQAYEMQNEQGQESYQAESKSKLDDLKEKAVLFQEFQGEEQRFDGTRAVDVSDHAEQIHKIETGSVVFRFKASKKRTAFYWERKIKRSIFRQILTGEATVLLSL
ncbi:hypothetical protein M5E84_07595 [[Ruminococcus] torques]|nr:hypothetical protein M5E84_07595 [[Ruminococcus] torques]